MGLKKQKGMQGTDNQSNYRRLRIVSEE